MILPTSILPPFIRANPEYSSLLGQSGYDWRSSSGYEFGQFVLSVNGRNVWISPEKELPLLLRGGVEHYILYSPGKMRIKLHLHYLRYHHGQAVRVRVPVQINFPKFPEKSGGRGQATSGASRTEYRSAVHNARRATSGFSSGARTGRADVPHSTTLRPSPETIFRPFIAVTEQFGITGPGVYTITQTVQSQKAYERTWTGSRTPNYGKLRKAALPVNPHSVVITDVRRNWLWTMNRAKDGSGYSSQTRQFTDAYPAPPPPFHVGLAQENALKRLLENAQLGIEANIAQDMAQMGQTFGVITNSATRIVKSVRQLKRGNIPGAVDALVHGRPRNYRTRKGTPSKSKTVAENWLEIQYGWKPLLQDIHGVLKTLPVLLNSGDYVQKAVGFGKGRVDQDLIYDPTAPGQSPGVTKEHRRSETFCKFVIRYRLSDPLKAFLAQTGFTNPINLAWEILPFSFVVDWFLPIGPYLEAFTAFDGLTFLDGSRTRITRRTVASAVDNYQTNTVNPTQEVVERGQFYSEDVILNRAKLVSFPSPILPSFRNGLASVTHAANAIALVKSVFGR